jgi:hypothetical protein
VVSPSGLFLTFTHRLGKHVFGVFWVFNVCGFLLLLSLYLYDSYKNEKARLSWSWAFVLSTDCLTTWKYSGSGLVFLHAAVKSVALRRAPSCQFKDWIYEKHIGFGCYFHDILMFLIESEKNALGWSWAFALSTDWLIIWKYSGRGLVFLHAAVKSVALRQAPSCQFKDRIYEKHTGFGCHFHAFVMFLIENKKMPKDDREPLSFRQIAWSIWKYSGRGPVFLHAAVKSVALRRAPSCQLKDWICEKHTGFGCYFHDIFMILIGNEKQCPKDDREPLSFHRLPDHLKI